MSISKLGDQQKGLVVFTNYVRSSVLVRDHFRRNDVLKMNNVNVYIYPN